MQLECPSCHALNDVPIEEIEQVESWTCAACGCQMSTMLASVIAEMPSGLHGTDERVFSDRIVPDDMMGRSMDDASQQETAVCDVPMHRIKHYEIFSFLGQGSSADVYLGRDVRLDRQVAVKLSRRSDNGSNGHAAVLVSEARAAARLQHPGIVQVYDVELLDDGRCAIVMEYVEGESLRAHLASLAALGKRVPPLQAARWMAAVADAVHHAHQSGLVHRDLKPGNILLDKRGMPRIADFGLALVDGRGDARPGEIAGTWPYMAPEQVRGEAHRLDGRCDVWAIGVILYELLTGRRPFNGQGAQLRDEILLREPKPPRQVDDSIPVELEDICLRCLAKDVRQRYRTAADVSRDLKRYIRTITLGRPAWRSRRLTGHLAAAVLLLGTATGILALALPGSSSRPGASHPWITAVGLQQSVRNFSVMPRHKWVAALDQSPARLFGNENPFQAWKYHAGAETLHMTGQASMYLAAGFCEVTNYSLSVRVTHVSDHAVSGLFFGVRPADEGSMNWFCQTLVIAPGADPPVLCRHLILGELLREFPPDRYFWPSLGFQSSNVPIPCNDGREHILEVQFVGSQLARVSWDNQPIEQLADDKLQPAVTAPELFAGDYRGFFGFYFGGVGSAQFSDLRFRRDY
jgi:serine/threonine protein kinase